MATKEQQQADMTSTERLDHPTLWTVVIDPPRGERVKYHFETKEDARHFLSALSIKFPFQFRYASLNLPQAHPRLPQVGKTSFS